MLKLIHCIEDEFEKGVFVSKYESFEIASIYNKSLRYMLVVSVLLFSLFYKDTSYALGFVSGGTACLVNFNLMVKSLEGMLNRTSYSRAFFNGNFLLRLILVSAVLLAALLLDSVNLFTAVAGTLTIRIVIAWEAISKHFKSFKDLE